MLDSTPYSKEIADLPLGRIAGTSYNQTAVQLEVGDLLLLYTDGISESWDASGEQLGHRKYPEVAIIHQHRPAGRRSMICSASPCSLTASPPNIGPQQGRTANPLLQ